MARPTMSSYSIPKYVAPMLSARPEGHPPEDGAHRRSQSAQDGDDEGLRREGSPEVGEDVVDGGEKAPRGGDEPGAQAEGDHRDPPRVHAHEGRRVLVLGGRPDGAPQVRLEEEPEHGGGEGEGDHERDRQGHAEGDVPEVEGLVGVAGGDVLVVRREGEPGDLGQHHPDPHRHEHLVLGEDRLHLDEGVQEELLDRHAQQEQEGHRDEERDVRVDPHRVEDEGHVHRQHHQLPVGQVDDPHDAHDQGHPDPDQGVQPALENPRDEGLQENVHGISRCPAGLHPKRAFDAEETAAGRRKDPPPGVNDRQKRPTDDLTCACPRAASGRCTSSWPRSSATPPRAPPSATGPCTCRACSAGSSCRRRRT